MPTDRLRRRQLLHGLLRYHFDTEELRSLCFDLGVDYDDLIGQGKDGIIRELILQSIRRNHTARLLERLEQLRPGVEWPKEMD